MKFVDGGKISTEHENLKDIEVAVEVPELENLSELSAFAGSDDAALKFVNKAIADGAKGVGRIALRQLPKDITKESFDSEATPRIQNLVKGYTPATSDGRVVRAKKVEKFDALSQLLASGKEVSRDELMQLLELSK